MSSRSASVWLCACLGLACAPEQDREKAPPAAATRSGPRPPEARPKAPTSYAVDVHERPAGPLELMDITNVPGQYRLYLSTKPSIPADPIAAASQFRDFILSRWGHVHTDGPLRFDYTAPPFQQLQERWVDVRPVLLAEFSIEAMLRPDPGTASRPGPPISKTFAIVVLLEFGAPADRDALVEKLQDLAALYRRVHLDANQPKGELRPGVPHPAPSPKLDELVSNLTELQRARLDATLYSVFHSAVGVAKTRRDPALVTLAPALVECFPNLRLLARYLRSVRRLAEFMPLFKRRAATTRSSLIQRSVESIEQDLERSRER